MGKAKYTESDIARQTEAAKHLIEELQTDDPTLISDMIEGETYFFEAIERALDEMDECDIVAEGIKAKVAAMNKRKAAAEARHDKLRGLIEQAFAVAEIPSHKFASATVTVKSTSPKVIITEEGRIPSRFFTPQPPKLDRKALLDELKANKAAYEAQPKDGEERKPMVKIEGAELSNGGQALQIRRT